MTPKKSRSTKKAKHEIEKNDFITIMANLPKEMHKLGFSRETIDEFRSLIDTTRKAHDVWKHGDQTYVTIDVCTEIPLQCCKLAD